MLSAEPGHLHSKRASHDGTIAYLRSRDNCLESLLLLAQRVRLDDQFANGNDLLGSVRRGVADP